jgi:hypothetical protein
MRKNVAYQVKSLAEKPGKGGNFFKTQEYMDRNASNNFNEREHKPEYLRGAYFNMSDAAPELASIPGIGGLFKNQNAVQFFNPKSPIADLAMHQGDTGLTSDDVLASINPLLKTPIEASTGTRMGTGIPIYGNPSTPAKNLFLGGKDYPMQNLASSFLGPWAANAGNIANDERSNLNTVSGLLSQALTGVRATEIDKSKAETGANLELKAIKQQLFNELQRKKKIPSDEALRSM